VSGQGLELTVHAIITLVSTTTVKVQSTTNAGNAACAMIKATSAYGSGDNATQISAIKIG